LLDAAENRASDYLTQDKALLGQRLEEQQAAQRIALEDLAGASFSSKDNDEKMDAHAVELLQANRRIALTAAVGGRDQAESTSALLVDASKKVRGFALREIQKSGKTPSRAQALMWTRVGFLLSWLFACPG